MSLDFNAAGDVNIGGDVVGRDKIINNIQNIVQRALTSAEAAQTEREVEGGELARGVSAFAQKLQARAGDEAATVTRGNPYKGLLTYRLSDVNLFFGRSRAIADVLGRLSAGSLAVIHAESGAGKSSLIQAGVMPRLIANGHLPVFLRPYTAPPHLAVKRAFLPDPGVAPLLATAPLRDFLHRVSSVLDDKVRLYVFLDQLEELFTLQHEAARDEFVNDLAECLDDSTLNVRWALSLRSEHFGNLATFRPRIKDPFANDYRLNRLTMAEAREVVTEPALRRSVRYEDGLVDRLLNDLGDKDVAPPELQLVCSALYDELVPGDQTISRATYDGLGGAVGILQNHLDRVLARDVAAEMRAPARSLMEALISSDRRRIIRPRTELVTTLERLKFTPIQFDPLVNQLMDSRLLRSYEPTAEHPEVGYELMHDYLVARISVDPAVQARKAAQEMLEQEVESFTRYKTLLSDDKLAILAPRRDELELNEQARRLLDLSQQAFRRRRGLLAGGVALVVVLVIVGVVSIVSALGAFQAQTVAMQGQQTAVVKVTEAGAQQQAAEQLAEAAQTQQAVANLGLSQAVQEATQAAASAATLVADAGAQRADAERRVAEKDAALTTLFVNNGLVPAGRRPVALAYDSVREVIWSASLDDDELLAIDPATGSITATLIVSPGISALAFDGQQLWAANLFSNTLMALDPATGNVQHLVATGSRPYALTYDGRLLWVVNQDDDSVQAVNPMDGSTVVTTTVGDRPWAIASGGRFVWVANRTSDSVTAIAYSELFGIEKTEGSTRTDDRVARPVALAWDPDQNVMWVANRDNNTLVAMTITAGSGLQVLAGRTIASSNLNRPSELIYRTGRLWVTNHGSNTLVPFNAQTGDSGAPQATGRLPEALIAGRDRLWVANFSDNTVQQFDPIAGDLTAAIAVGTQPRAFALGPDGRMWTANSGSNQVIAVDTETRLAGTAYATGRGPRSLAFDDRDYLWVVNGGDRSLQRINVQTGESTTFSGGIGEGPREIIWEPVTERLWFLNRNRDNRSTVQWIDPRTFQVSDEIEVGASGSEGFTLVAAAGRVWVTLSRTREVKWIDPQTQSVSAGILVGANPGGLLFESLTNRLWVCNFEDNTLMGIDVATDQVAATLDVNAGPTGLAFDGALIWLSNFDDNTVQSIDPLTLRISPPIPVGSGPIRLEFDGQRVWIANFNSRSVQFIRIQR